ncbi:MAG: hypothetical protein EHM23_33935 [Acidobacteria bacterium]|nr:MAG: hypothetical protein EHM23_33935 [Acidobacteriota bacterium]
MSDLTREDLLDILESSLVAQLKAVRSLRSGKPKPQPAEVAKRRSNTEIAEDLLREAGRPLHVTELIELAHSRLARPLSRESLVSALTKKVLEKRTFRRVGPNTFDLISREPRS